MTIMDTNTALITVARYSCAGCWGRIDATMDAPAGHMNVICPKCGDDRGFTLKKVVEKRRYQDAIDAAEVKNNLFPEPVTKKSTAQLIAELGF